MLSFYHQTLKLPERTIGVSTLAREGALVGLLLDLDPESASERFLERGLTFNTQGAEPIPGFIEELSLYATGEPIEWRTPVYFEEGTPFQQKIWEAIAKIPHGESVTYAELAIRVGAPGGARAAGGACGRNPIPLRVPCHRVVATGGSIGGFTGEMATKRALLRHEGVAPFADGPLFSAT